MKILVLCGMGLGSSHFISMNLNDILEKYDLDDIEVENSDILSASFKEANIYIGADYLLSSLDKEYMIKLEDILDEVELETKFLNMLEQINGND
ncbi:hypothetical protein WG909_09410 [Peptostreptococcaceae bacterium AGR-M142]